MWVEFELELDLKEAQNKFASVDIVSNSSNLGNSFAILVAHPLLANHSQDHPTFPKYFDSPLCSSSTTIPI